MPSLTWGTAQRPFSADSPWNSRPIGPRFANVVVPESVFFPAVQNGAYSSAVFTAAADDAPVEVMPLAGQAGIWDADTETHRASIKVPRWPTSALPAAGGDGHCDVVDPVLGVIHSFWQLQRDDGGVWHAAQYTWSPLKGRGWGDPAHYFQGARAAGVPTAGGLIRIHEANDGDTVFRHALAMSMTYNGLSAAPAYAFPATGADRTAATTNSGNIPEGALMMLPADFDTSTIGSVKLRKVAETLKLYGAYVVDRNYGTPFLIYAEIGSDFNLHEGGWNAAVAADLTRMRQALRMVTSASRWVDGNGEPVDLKARALSNLLSMRGPWRLQSGGAAGEFDTWKQAVVFPAAPTKVVQLNNSGRGMGTVSWAAAQAGQRYRVTARTTGGGQFRLALNNCEDKSPNIDSGVLNNGASFDFTWPAAKCYSYLYALSGVNQVSTVAAELRALDQ